MKIFLVLFIVVAACASCSKNSITGSGNTITETRLAGAFTSVQLESSGKVNLLQGAQQKVEVTGYENLVPVYETYVQNSTLVLKFKNDYYNIHNNNITINITVPAVTKIGINGSGEYSVGNFSGANFSALINGSGDIFFTGCAYQKTDLKVNGSGYIKAQQLQSAEADAEINGSGRIDISCWEKLKATIHGSGEINYWGNPGVTAEVNGSGSVKKR